MTKLMLVYAGMERTTEVTKAIIDLGGGAGACVCLECGGGGDWTKFHPEPELGPFPCVQCKGTGMMLVSI